MSFPALSMSGMPGVLVGFVDHLQARRGESLGQLLGDDIASCHGLGIAGAGTVGQSGENRSPRSGVGRCPSEREACLAGLSTLSLLQHFAAVAVPLVPLCFRVSWCQRKLEVTSV